MNMRHRLSKVLLLWLIVLSSGGLQAQTNQYSASSIQHDLKKLNTLGNVLYVAAHPDDENTRLIAYLANEALLNTAYLSVTRGDGGQNLIGPEIREMLGVIRTQELLQARNIDGGKQFFTRANDFGYSKIPQETLEIWDKEEVLADVVWVIRKFRPDVIITRFPPDGRGGHGHHTSSAILAEEAFDAAADPSRFTEQLQYVQPWQTRSLLFNTHPWFRRGEENFDSSKLITLDVGAYNTLLGKSYTEIAAESRSMHKSQGFGAGRARGSEPEYLRYVKGEQLPLDFFEKPIMTWNAIEGSNQLAALISAALDKFDPSDPSGITPLLVDALKASESMADPYWRNQKQDQIKHLIKSTLGLYLEASTNSISSTPGDTVGVRLEITNRSRVPVMIRDIEITGVEIPDQPLGNNHRFEQGVRLRIPENQPYSQSYWLRQQGTMGMFKVDDQQMIGMPQNQPAIQIPIGLEVMGKSIVYEVPLVYKKIDPVKGEVIQPFSIAPPVTVNFMEKIQVFADESPRSVIVVVKSDRDAVTGTLKLDAPKGWTVTPDYVPIKLELKGEEQQISFALKPPVNADEAHIRAVARVNGQDYSMERVTIDYDHIPTQILLPPAQAKVVKLDIIAGGMNIGYIMGAGDEIPNSLQQIGYSVDIIQPDNISQSVLRNYSAVILGIRALNTVDRLKYKMSDLLTYAERGGTLIVQYNTSHRLVTDEFAPYSLTLSRDRVSVEDSEVKLLLPDHRVLNYPNQISVNDFQGWVQERGLYFPGEWDPKFQAILEMNDPGETPKQGGLLVAEYGEGHYIYTGLSWFRELPAGVPGAYRLFANLVSLGQKEPEN